MKTKPPKLPNELWHKIFSMNGNSYHETLYAVDRDAFLVWASQKEHQSLAIRFVIEQHDIVMLLIMLRRGWTSAAIATAFAGWGCLLGLKYYVRLNPVWDKREWDREASRAASLNEHEDCLQYLLNNGCPDWRLFSPQLVEVLKIRNTRPSIDKFIKQICGYIKRNNLQDPKNKRKIIPNQDLMRLMKFPDDFDGPITYFNLHRLLKHHLPLHPWRW